MNILNKIKKKWDFSKSVKQNAIYFNTQKNAEKKARKKMLFLAFFIISVAMFFNNPLLGMAMIIGAISFGSEAVFNSASTTRTSVAVLDSTHIVVTYSDGGNSSYGTACVGVISGTTITWGSEYVFNSATSWPQNQDTVASIDSTHFVVVFRDAGDGVKGKAVIGTVANGNEISYGTTYTFSAVSSSELAVCMLDATHVAISFVAAGVGKAIIGVITSTDVITFGSLYTFSAFGTGQTTIIKIDSTHFVVSYKVTHAHSKIGTVASGDEISYGTVANMILTAGGSQLTSCLLDSTHFVISGRFTDDGSKGRANVGVISGSTITPGTPVTFSVGDVFDCSMDTVDSTHCIIAFKDANNSNYGSVIAGTISGNAISFSDLTAFNTTAQTYISLSMIDSTKFAICYVDASTYGTGIIGTVSFGVDYFKTLSETITINDTLLNKTSRVFYEALSIVDSISVQKTLKRTLSETITIVDNIDAKKIATKILNEVISITDTIVKKVIKTFSEIITIVDNISIQKVLYRTLTEVISIVDNVDLTKVVVRVFTEAITIVDIIAKKTIKIFSETISIIDNLSRQLIKTKVLSEVMTIVDTVKYMVCKNLVEIITIVDTITKITAQVLLETITLVESLYIKLNGVNVKWLRKYSEKVGSFTRKYSEKVGTFIKKYYKDI